MMDERDKPVLSEPNFWEYLAWGGVFLLVALSVACLFTYILLATYS